jgi:hypothetical protein
MDRVEYYRHSICDFLNKYVNAWQEEGIDTQLIIDSERDRYLILRVGWEGDRRINNVVFQFDIKNGKIWIQENNTDVEIDRYLEEIGISKQEIVVGFHHPLMRESSDFAVA